MRTLASKLNIAYGIKTFDLKIEDVDEGNRIVKGYLSAFDKFDSDDDVLRKGAFKKSLQERGPSSSGNRKIAHLRNHDWNQQIGFFKELTEDSTGLHFVSQLGTSSNGSDALADYQEGILREHSIGFNYVDGKIKFVEESSFSDSGHWEITEVKLWEGSGVTFGANEFTPTIEANKSLKDSDFLLNLNNEMNILIKSLKNGKGTDGRLENIELRLKQIQQKYNTLIEMQPSIKGTLVNEPIETKSKNGLLLIS